MPQLRCYECFALHFTDFTVDQLINQLKNNNDRERVKALLVITHLISYSGEQAIKRRYKDIMRHLNELLNDGSIGVKKAMVKIIVAFSCKKILLDKGANIINVITRTFCIGFRLTSTLVSTVLTLFYIKPVRS